MACILRIYTTKLRRTKRGTNETFFKQDLATKSHRLEKLFDELLWEKCRAYHFNQIALRQRLAQLAASIEHHTSSASGEELSAHKHPSLSDDDAEHLDPRLRDTGSSTQRPHLVTEDARTAPAAPMPTGGAAVESMQRKTKLALQQYFDNITFTRPSWSPLSQDASQNISTSFEDTRSDQGLLEPSMSATIKDVLGPSTSVGHPKRNRSPSLESADYTSKRYKTQGTEALIVTLKLAPEKLASVINGTASRSLPAGATMSHNNALHEYLSPVNGDCILDLHSQEIDPVLHNVSAALHFRKAKSPITKLASNFPFYTPSAENNPVLQNAHATCNTNDAADLVSRGPGSLSDASNASPLQEQQLITTSMESLLAMAKKAVHSSSVLSAASGSQETPNPQAGHGLTNVRASSNLLNVGPQLPSVQPQNSQLSLKTIVDLTLDDVAQDQKSDKSPTSSVAMFAQARHDLQTPPSICMSPATLGVAKVETDTPPTSPRPGIGIGIDAGRAMCHALPNGPSLHTPESWPNQSTSSNAVRTKTLNIELLTDDSKVHKLICVSTDINIQDLFTKVQKRMDRRLASQQIQVLGLRLANHSTDAGSFSVETDDPDTWKMFLRRAVQTEEEEVDVVAEVEV